MKFRRGVSLMEVLVSIGVVAVGLMGVATLIPLAFQQAETGAQNERKASLSKLAFRDFRVSGMANPSNWANPTGLFATGDVDVTGAQYHSVGVRSAFCIDPRWVANNVYHRNPDGTLFLATPADLKNHFTFPFAPTGAFSLAEIEGLWRGEIQNATSAPPVMPRITVRSFAGAQRLPTPAVSDEICVALDDLEFELPDQATLPPVQTALTGAMGPIKRYAQGRFSWFVTVVPDDGVSDLYKLSIAVCRERDLDKREVAVPVQIDYRRLADLPSGTLEGVGFGGGEVSVDISASGPLTVKPGEYVMLARHVATPTFDAVKGNRIYKQRFQWYRVVAIDNVLATGNDSPNRAHVSLVGADWDFRPVVYGGDWQNGQQVTYLIHTPSVVSVFEKTVRLER